MTVVFDLLGFQSRDHGERGIARYVLHLALAIERTNPGLIDQYLVHSELPLPTGAEALLSTGRVVRTDRRPETRWPSAGGVFVAASMFENLRQPVDYVLPNWARSPYWRTATVLFDLIPARYPDWYLDNAEDRHAYGARAAALASMDRLLAISQASADDAQMLLGVEPDRLTVIGAGADGRFRRPLVHHSEVAESLVERNEVPGLRPGYILFPTGIDPRKNVQRTIEAYGRLDPALRRQHQLVLVCRLDDNGARHVADLAYAAGVSDDLLATGFVSDEVLLRLYQGAHLVLFPSLYEGFGLPVLEAMQCGAPVICADSSSLKEVQLITEARFDPTSAQAIAEAIERVVADDALRDRLRTQELPSYSWDDCARLSADVIRGLQRQNAIEAAVGLTHKPRLALFSPLPPQRSGIADYTYRLLEELRHHCHVTVFVDVVPGAVTAPDGVEIHPVDLFDAVEGGGGAFDQVLYFLGNSPFHIAMLEVLRRRPGAVFLHDARLTELYGSIYRATGDNPVGNELVRWYPHRYQPWLEGLDTIGQELANRFGLLLTREVAAAAERILVHSDYAATLVELDSGAEPLAVYPLPCPAPATTDGDVPRRARPDVPVIASFGLVAEPKRPEVMIEALAVVRRTMPRTELHLVGGVEPGYRASLESLAADAGVAGAVVFTDHLDPVSFASAQRRSTVAVQLRSFSNGESSAAVSELMSAGVPTVVSNLGSMAELPNDTVVKVAGSVGGPELGRILTDLLADDDRLDRISVTAVDYARANTFAQAAVVLAKTLFG